MSTFSDILFAGSENDLVAVSGIGKLRLLGALEPCKCLGRLSHGSLEDSATAGVDVGPDSPDPRDPSSVLLDPAVLVHGLGRGVSSGPGVRLRQTYGGEHTFHVAQLQGILTL